jgi:homoserine dehydrogenase
MSRVGIGILGCGSVGSQVARILLNEGEILSRRCGIRLELRHVVVRSPSKAREVSLPQQVMSSDPRAILADPEVDIVVELAGGTGIAKEFILGALAAGKQVVTANKALLALHGRELFGAARAARRCIAFEAAVGGGIPLIESIRRGLVANRIDALFGILNGTSNYILTRMLENNASYAHALAEAQRLGYAEADPTLDVEGVDAAHKLTILASLAMRCDCDFRRIDIRGISEIDLRDLTSGDELGYRCKLLAAARRHDDGLELAVQPTFIPQDHPLAGVSGPFNGLSVYGDHVGHVFFSGRGAGGEATASAVISDIIEVALGNSPRTFEQIAVLADQNPPPVYRASGQHSSAYYMRVGLRDQPGGIGRIATALGNEGISIATIVQHEPPNHESQSIVPVIVTTHPTQRTAIDQAVDRIAKFDMVATRPVCIQILEELHVG